MTQYRFAVYIVFAFYSAIAFAQKEEDDAQAISIANRFVSILEKNPQRGTALEKVFSHHLQRGTLDSFVEQLQQRTKANSGDGVAWMLLGLIESQRRMDSEAIVAFMEAEKLRPNDALPAYYRGQSLLRIGEPSQATEAFEIAIQRKPTRIVLLEIFEQLGRTHQRLNQNELAIAVWKRLEAQFPGDTRVLEQIASILNQEGAYADALPRYQKLVLATKDAYQRTQFRIEAAQIQIRLGANAKGMAELETILGDLKPDGWLYREVQRKIEEVFLKSSDQAGLVGYYESKLGMSPDDIESMVRLCKFLVSSGRISEANGWMTQAIARAPSRIDLRITLIDQLIADQQLTAAADQFSQLAQLDPKNLDVLRDWGKTVLRDPAHTVEEAKRQASTIWKKSLEHRIDDALAHIQVADLHLSAQIPDVAMQLFKRATELAPEQAQYHEYYGDFLFQQNQQEEAFAEWNSIAEGPRRNANNVMRLAEIYEHAKQFGKAADLAMQACALAPEDSSLYVRTARLQRKANQIDGSLASLVSADKFADSEDQREFILLERMAILEASNRLKSAVQVLQTQMRQEKNPSVAQWVLLSRYLVYQKRWKEANAAVSEAVKLDETNSKMLVLSADIAEGLGKTEASVKSLRKLAELDRRKRQDYLERIAKLRVRQKKWPEAIEVAEEVVVAAPSRIESYEFLAQVCIQAKKPEQAIEALRKAIRIDPDSSRLTLALGNALAENKKLDEAIELVWQALAKAPSLDEKVDLTLRLAKLVAKQNQLVQSSNGTSLAASQLIDRLEAGRKDPTQRRDLTVCLSQLYQSRSDFANAKRTLEELLSDRARDTSVLQKLAKLCAAADDIEMAIDYQRQLVAIVPGSENESYLAGLLRQRGDWFEADEIVARLLQNETDTNAVLQSIDGLLRRGDFELVLKTLEPMVRKEPDSWELLFRLGLAHSGVDQWPQALAAFERILALDVDHTSNRQRIFKSNPPTTQLSDGDALKLIERPELADIAMGRESLTTDAIQIGTGTKWAPEGFGAVRIASMAWLVCCESNDSAGKSEWIRRVITQADSNPSHMQWMDALAIAKFRQDTERQIAFGAELASGGDPELQAYYLELIRRRHVSGVADENEDKKPLTGAQLELMLEAYSITNEEAFTLPAKLSTSSNAFQTAALVARIVGPTPRSTFTTNVNGTVTIANGSGGVMTSAGIRTTNFPSSVSAGNLPLRNEGFVRTVVSELRFAGQPEQAESFLVRQTEAADSEFQLASLCEYLLSSQRFKEIERPLMRWFELQYLQLQEVGDFAPLPATGIPTALAVRNPAEFAVRLIENWGEPTSSESSLRILDTALAASNLRFSSRSLPLLIAPSLMQSTQLLGGVQPFPNQNSPSRQLWCKCFVSLEEQKLLAATKQVFVRADSVDVWMSYLQKRIAESDPEMKPLEQLRLALFSDQDGGDRSRRIEIEAMKTIGQRPEFALHAAAALLAHGDFRESLQLAENSQPENPHDSLMQQLIILHAATSINDKAKTEASLQAIANEKLDPAVQPSLVFALQKANAMGVASAKKFAKPGVAPQIASPTRRQPSMSAEALRAQQMLDFAKKGNNAEAIKLAKQFVSKPRVFSPTVPINGNLGPRPPSLAAQNSVNFSRAAAQRTNPTQVSASAGLRSNAWGILKKLGELENLIVETEQRLAASPNSFLLLELLAEYYEVAGKVDLAEKTTLRALQVRPSASQLRIRFATGLANAAKKSEACDQILELLRHDLKNALPMFSEFAEWFEACGRSDDLRDAVLASNFRLVANLERYLSVGKELMDRKNGFEIGATILEKLVEADPSLRPQTLQLVYGTGVSPYPRLMRFIKDALIPNENEAILDPWFGLRDAPFLQTSDTLFEQLLACHRGEDIVEKLEPFIQRAVDRMPGWFAGRMMLALIAAKTDRRNVAKDHFVSLAGVKRLHVGIPDEVAARLAIELMQLPEARATAIALTEPLLASNRFVYVDLESRPIIMLAKLLVADGQRAKAIDILTQEHESGRDAAMTSARYQTFLNSAAGRSEPVKIPMLADHLLTIGLPVESFRLFDFVVSTERRRQTELMIQRKGLFTSREDGMRAAIQLLESLPAEKAIFELLQDRSKPSKNRSALELMFQVPLAKDTSTQSMESAMQRILVRHAKAGKLADIEQSLQKFAANHPSDVSVLATQAVLRLTTGEGNAEIALNELERALTEHDGTIADYAAPEDAAVLPYEDRKHAEMILATWLVARQCYEAKQHLELAGRLSDRAFQCALFLDRYHKASQARNLLVEKGASNQPLNETIREAEFANNLLFEWGRVQLQAGRIGAGLGKWQELVNAIGIASAKNPPIADGPDVAGPKQAWTQNQFDWLIRLANLAVDVKQVDFAKQIAKKIATCQLPAEYSTIRVGSALTTKRLDPVNSVQAICALLTRFGEDETAAELGYELLLPILLLGDQRVCLYPADLVPLNLLRERPHCVAEKLVFYALQCKRIGDLKSALEVREPSLNQIVMLTQIAIAEKDNDRSSALLGELDSQLHLSKMTDALVAVAQVAIPAFQIAELRDAALPILEKLMAEVKRSNRIAESDFQFLPLVQEVDEYLRNRNRLPPSPPPK